MSFSEITTKPESNVFVQGLGSTLGGILTDWSPGTPFGETVLPNDEIIMAFFDLSRGPTRSMLTVSV